MSTETYKALDMDKLLENSFICDAQYSVRICNPILVLKSNKKW